MAQGSEVNGDFGNKLLNKLGWGSSLLTEWLGFWALSLPWAQVQFVVAELRSLKLCSPAKNLKKKKKDLLNKQGWYGQFMLKAIMINFC